MKETATVLFITFIGIALGVVLGIYIPFYACILFDKVFFPEDVGGGLFAVGWILLFFTVPVSAALTPIILLKMYKNKFQKAEESKLRKYLNNED